MNVADSSGWLEYFADAENAEFFSHAIEDVENLVVPTLTLYEVFKRIYQQRGEDDALQAVSRMQQGVIADLSAPVAVTAAQLGVRQQLPLADSVILATARSYDATLWTQDADFEGVEDVQYVAKRRQA